MDKSSLAGSGSRIKVQVDTDLKALIPGFLKNRQKDIITITQALAAQDFTTIARLGHSMKGNGSGYGFDKISELGVVIEIAANQQNVAEIKRLVAELSDFLDHVDIDFV